jgi:diaminohydroxyphosphoribosylaminopyrimidine deaminase / 5-amino-6-(5-phosphoribosylamino)uracil reductase
MKFQVPCTNVLALHLSHTMQVDEIYMRRCLQLATQGGGWVSPNPMVGAVLVHGDRMIGEGFTQPYGQEHAEVICLQSVDEADLHLIPHATLYVSLEPCNHYGQTPPCSDLILRHKIQQVVIGCVDPFEKVNGSGIKKLQEAGVHVRIGVLEKECVELNKRFFCFHQKKRPYIILKWAASANNQIAESNFAAVAISNEMTNRLTHKWRSEEAAIIVGTNTALHDNPSLTTRHWKGKNPTRLVIDLQLKIPKTHRLFSEEAKTIVLNAVESSVASNIYYEKLDAEKPFLQNLVDVCLKHQLSSLLVEGGTKLLQTFIDADMWDEARIIVNTELQIENGIEAPHLKNESLQEHFFIHKDEIRLYENKTN